MYSVGARVDGLYAGGDVWFPGLIDGANADGSYAIQYDDGEREEAVHEACVRPHVAGTFSVGSRVFARYNGGDDWYPGVISDINCDAETYDIAYDDGEFEPGVAFAMVEDESTADKPAAADDNDEEEEDPNVSPSNPSVLRQDGAPLDCESAAEDATQAIDPGDQPLDSEPTDTTQDANTRATDSTALVAQDDGQREEQPEPLSADNAGSSSLDQDPSLPDDAESPRERDEDAPEDAMSGRTSGRSTPMRVHDANVDTSVEIDVSRGNTIPTPLPLSATSLPPPNDMLMFIAGAPTIDKPSLVDERRDSTPRSVASDEILCNVLHHESETRRILKTVGAPVTDNDSMLVVKNALASFLQQLRVAPQLTVDWCRECRGESILLDCIRDNASYSILVCFAFVIIRRICAVSDAAFTTFIELHVIECVARIMGQFPHDAVLQASACGVLATLARSTGIQVMIELQVALLVIDVLKEHQALNHYSRQVHFYACEVLAKLCDGGDVRVIRLMTAKDPACHSPVHLFVLLLRQGHQHEDQKVACAACTLVLCLAARDRECANVLRSMGALADVSTIMAKYPNDNGIAAYSQSATREIALSSMKNGATTKVQETAKGILKKEDLRLGGELFDPKPPKPKARKSANKPSLAMDTPTKTTTLFSRNTMSPAPQLSHNVADSITKIQQRTQKKALIDSASMPPSSVKKRTASAWEQPTETKHTFVPFEQKLEMRMLHASNRKASVVTSPSKSHDREIVLLKTYGVPKIRNIDRVRGLPTASSTTRQKPSIPKQKPPATSFTARPPHTKTAMKDAEKAGKPRERPLVKTPKPSLDEKRMKTPEPKTTMTIKVVKQNFAKTPPSPSRDVQPSDMSQLATQLFQPAPTLTRLSESRLSFSDKLHEMIKRAEVALCRPASSQRLDVQDMETTVKFDESELPKKPAQAAAIEKLSPSHAKPPPKPPKPTKPPRKEATPPLKPAPSARGGRGYDHAVGKPRKDPPAVEKTSSPTMKPNAFQRPPSPKPKPTSPKTPTNSRADHHKADSIPQPDAKPADENPPTPREAERAQESAASEVEPVEMPPIERRDVVAEVSVSNVSEPSGVVNAMPQVSAPREVHVDPSSKNEAPRDEIKEKEETSEVAMEESPTTDEEPLDEQMNEPNSARTAASYDDDEFESLEDDAEAKQPLDQSDEALDTIERLEQVQVVSDKLGDEVHAAMDAPSDSKEDLDQAGVHGESSESTLDAVSHDKDAEYASSEIHVASPELCPPSLHTAGSNDADHGIDVVDGEDLLARKSEMEHDLLASSITTRTEDADPWKDTIAQHEESSDGHENDEAHAPCQADGDPALDSNATEDTTTAHQELSAIQTHALVTETPRNLMAHDEPSSLATDLTEDEAQAAGEVTHQAVENTIAPSNSPQEMQHEEIAPSDAQTAEPPLTIEGRIDDGCLESIARQEEVDEMLQQQDAKIPVKPTDEVDERDGKSAQPDTSPPETHATDVEPIDEQIDVQTPTSSAQSQESHLQVTESSHVPEVEQSKLEAHERPQVEHPEPSPSVQTTLLDMRDDEFQPELAQDELMCLPEELHLGQETLVLEMDNANAADKGSSDESNSTQETAVDQSIPPATDRTIDTGEEAPWDAGKKSSEEKSNVSCEIKQVSEQTTDKTLVEDQGSPLTSKEIDLVSLEANRRDKRDDDDGDPSSREELKYDQLANDSDPMDKVDGKHSDSLSLATEDLPQTDVDDSMKTPPCVESSDSHGDLEAADVCNLNAHSELNGDSAAPNNILSQDSSSSYETKEETIASSAARLQDSTAPPSDSTRMDECREPSKDLSETHAMDTTSENVSEAKSDTTAPSESDDAMDGLDAETTAPSTSLDVDEIDDDQDPYGEDQVESLGNKAERTAHADAEISSKGFCEFSESTTFAESRAMEASVESPGNSQAWTAVDTQQEANDTNDSAPMLLTKNNYEHAESTSFNEGDAADRMDGYPPEIAHGHPNVDGESSLQPSSDETIVEPSAMTEVVETAEPEVAVEAPVVEPPVEAASDVVPEPSEVVAEAVVEAAAEPTEDAIAVEAPVEAAVEPVVDVVVEAEPVVEPVVDAVTAPSEAVSDVEPVEAVETPEPVVESVAEPIVDAAVDAVEAHAHGPLDAGGESNRREDSMAVRHEPLESVSVENEESAIQESHAVHRREEMLSVEKAGQVEPHEQIAAPLRDQQVGAQDIDAGIVPTGDLISVHANETLSMPSKSARSETLKRQNDVEKDLEKSPGASMPSNDESKELRLTPLALDRLGKEQGGDEDPYDGDDFESEREPPSDQATDELVGCHEATTTDNGKAHEDQVAGDSSCLEETPPMDSTSASAQVEYDAMPAAKEDLAAKSANIEGDTALGNDISHEASTPVQSAEAFMTTTEDLSTPREEPKLHEEASPNTQIDMTNEDGGNSQEKTAGNDMEVAEDALRPQSGHERRKSTDESELMELKATPRSSISSSATSSASSSTLSSSSSTTTSLSTSASSNPSHASEHKSKNEDDSYDQEDFDQLDNMEAAKACEPLPTNDTTIEEKEASIADDVESTSRVDLERFDDHAAVPTVENESNGSVDDAQVAAPSSRDTMNRPSEDVMVTANDASTSISTAVDAPSVPTIDLRGLNAMQDNDLSEPSRRDEPTRSDKPEDALVHGMPDGESGQNASHDDGHDAPFGLQRREKSPSTSWQVSPVLKEELTAPHGDESTALPSTDSMNSPVVKTETEATKMEHPVEHAMEIETETQQHELDFEASESSSSTSAMKIARSTSSTDVEIDPVLHKDASTKSADNYEEDEFESASDAPSTSRKDDDMSPREPPLDIHPRHESERSDDSDLNSAPSDKLDATLLSTLDDTPKEESKQATEAPAAVEASRRRDAVERAEEGKEAPPIGEEDDPQLGEDIYADDDFED